MSSTVIFTGHMIDRPGRARPRFAAHLAPRVAQSLSEELERVGAVDGFASAACGGDILFLEALLARGARAHVVLPCAVESFRRDCVDVIPGSDWGSRFDRILGTATTVEVLGEQYASDNAMASECCYRVMIGLAARSAEEKREEPLVIALWDGTPGDAAGGTYSAVQYSLERDSVRLMTDLFSAPAAGTTMLEPMRYGTSSAIRHVTWVSEAPQQICAIVFADAVGFSKLPERDMPRFLRHYLFCAMQALETQSLAPLVKNTWGDGLYLIFESMREAGLFALDFRDRILSTEWCLGDSTWSPSVRIGVHAGPLYAFLPYSDSGSTRVRTFARRALSRMLTPAKYSQVWRLLRSPRPSA